MVGGSWMLWHLQRASTRDVDSARRFETDLGEAVDRVGSRHNLRQGWLNDAAAAFWPAGASYDDCESVYEHEALVVRTPSAEIVFVMKLYRADPQDRETSSASGRSAASLTPTTPSRPSGAPTRTHPRTSTWPGTSPRSPTTPRRRSRARVLRPCPSTRRCGDLWNGSTSVVLPRRRIWPAQPGLCTGERRPLPYWPRVQRTPPSLHCSRPRRRRERL